MQRHPWGKAKMVWAIRKSLKLVKSWLLNHRSGCGTEMRVVLGVIMGRECRAERGKGVVQVLGDLFYLLLFYLLV